MQSAAIRKIDSLATGKVSRADQLTTKIVETRHGRMKVYNEDELVAFSLETYGEYSEGEVVTFGLCLKPGDVALDVGANIGAFTVPMAQLVGDDGTVYAFEASQPNIALLRDNLALNDLANVKVVPCAASDHFGNLKVSNQDALHAYCRKEINEGDFEVSCVTIDSMELPKCKFIKIDVDRHELQVLKGAEETIRRCRPILYFENESGDLREELVAWVIDHGYRCYWHRPYHFNADNWKGEKRNLFGALISIMTLAIPDEQGWEIKGLEEVSDYRQDDQMFLREADRYLKYVKRDNGDLQSRWMAAHHFNLMQQRDDAKALIRTNLKLDPEHVPTLALQAYMRLQDGEYNKDTWAGYEIRHKQANRHQFGGDRVHTVPAWQGEQTDEVVLVTSEQGFGDCIMFARFMRFVLERAPNAILEVRPELYELFEHSWYWFTGTILKPGQLFRLGRTLPEYQKFIPLPSTAWALGADKPMIYCPWAYLHADKQLAKNWQGKGNIRLGQTREGPLMDAKIGLCATGSATSERPYTRDLPKSMIVPLVHRFGPVFPLEQEGARFESFAMTAAAISVLDLVITVDTSVAHLAGALGKETWLLLSYDPDFRWGLTDERTIWYPSIKIFRQPKFRDWPSVIDRVTAELAAR